MSSAIKDLAARLQATPRHNTIGYSSWDASQFDRRGGGIDVRKMR